MEGGEQASAEPHEGLELSCDWRGWRGWRGRRGWRDWQARYQVRFHLNATSRFVVGDRHWPVTARLHKHLYLRKLKPTQAPNHPRERGTNPQVYHTVYPYTRTPTVLHQRGRLLLAPTPRRLCIPASTSPRRPTSTPPPTTRNHPQPRTRPPPHKTCWPSPHALSTTPHCPHSCSWPRPEIMPAAR
jgi:hypothetical protein